jgi:hypothetical protein
VGDVEGLAEVAVRGDRLASLETLRDRLAREIDVCGSGRDLAALATRFADVLEQIESLAPPEMPKGNPLDELEAKRAAVRGATPAGRVSAGRGRGRG